MQKRVVMRIKNYTKSRNYINNISGKEWKENKNDCV